MSVENNIPEIERTAQEVFLRVPEIINKCSGIKIFGKHIKSLVYTTDVAIIKNCNSDAVFAVYPFAPQPIINETIIQAANTPVFSGVGGGITGGRHAINQAVNVEYQGSISAVVNAKIKLDLLEELAERTFIPIVVTVVKDNNIKELIEAGADILNIAAGEKTVDLTNKIRNRLPDAPIIATGGVSEENIEKTINAGANAIIYTPPTNEEIFKEYMEEYR